MHIEILSTGPYDLQLCLRAAASYSPDKEADLTVFRTPVRLGGQPRVLEARQERKNGPLEVMADGVTDKNKLRRKAEWILNTGLDLRLFYEKAAAHPALKKIIDKLHGLKAMRPASLFQMGVIAVTEQQISMQAARRIRERIVDKFGGSIQGLPVFPKAEDLAKASLEELKERGLSGRKAEYVQGFARAVENGSLDLDALKTKPDDEVRDIITELRGFGRWSADYILVRGLGRMDAVPYGDLGVQRAAGEVLGDGSRMSPEEVKRALEFCRPFRGLAAFYLLTRRRL